MSDRLLQKQSENEGQMVDAISKDAKEILAVVNREAKQARENYLQVTNDLRSVRDEMSKTAARVKAYEARQFSDSQTQTAQSENSMASREVASSSNEPQKESRAYWPDIKDVKKLANDTHQLNV